MTLRLQHAQDQLVERPVEHLAQKAGARALAAVLGSIHELVSLDAVAHQPLFLHDAEEGLRGVERQLAVRTETVVDPPHAPLAQLPQHLEDFQFAFAGRHIGHDLGPESFP